MTSSQQEEQQPQQVQVQQQGGADDGDQSCCPSSIHDNLSWLSGWMIRGLGMFSNAYVMLAVGNLGPILEHANPKCWGRHTHPSCSDALRASFRYSLFIGIIFGMAAGGWIGDAFGRRKGSILTAVTMMFGCILITGSYAGTDEGTFTMYSVSLAIFGLGVGGEYPMTAAASAEQAELERAERAELGLDPPADRGKKVVLPFTMQGLGNLVNTFLIFALLLMFGQDTHHYDARDLTIIWRLQYGLALLPLGCLIYYRYYYLKESGSWEKMKSRITPESRKIFFAYYWHRLVGTGGGWLAWDLLFYGNKLFQTQFVRLFHPDGDAEAILREAVYVAIIAYVGYFFSVYTIDTLGRMKLQIMGFIMMFVLFTIAGVWFDQLTTSSGLPWLRLLYYLSTFFGQFGPNCTTWLFPAEVFPTHFRALGHGLSGALGPGLGAMLGGLVFSYTDSRVAFLICGGCSLVGVLLTVLFLPELKKMNLDCNDEFWNTLVARHAGRTSTYVGDYTNHLSVFEEYCWWNAAIGETFALRSPLLGNQHRGGQQGAGGGGGGDGDDDDGYTSPQSPNQPGFGTKTPLASPLRTPVTTGAQFPANASGNSAGVINGNDSSALLNDGAGTGGGGGMAQRETSYLSLGAPALQQQQQSPST